MVSTRSSTKDKKMVSKESSWSRHDQHSHDKTAAFPYANHLK